mgnify:FL=1
MVFQEFISTVAKRMEERYKEMGQDYSVTIKNRERVNRENSCSIVVKKPGQLQQPGIVMNSFYADFSKGKKKMDEIIDQLMKTVEEENLGIQLNGSYFTKDRILKNIRMELINVDRNRELLSHVPHRMVADLAVIYKYIIQDTGEGIIDATLTNHMIAGMGIHEDELFQMAMDNRRENAPYVIGNLEDVIHGLNESLGMEETPEEDGLDSFLDCSVLTSQDGLFGASCILYPEAVKELAAAKGGNFFLLPSSIHEWLVIPDVGIYDGLEDIVRFVNQNEVGEEEVLSDHVYYYDVQKQELSIHQAGEEIEMDADINGGPDMGRMDFLS